MKKLKRCSKWTIESQNYIQQDKQSISNRSNRSQSDLTRNDDLTEALERCRKKFTVDQLPPRWAGYPSWLSGGKNLF